MTRHEFKGTSNKSLKEDLIYHKCTNLLSHFRSRTKNFMWYGVLGGKEILQRTFKNLDQKVQLECDGQKIPLPSLQGIVILNIPRYV